MSSTKSIRALRPFAYSLDGVTAKTAAVGETVTLRAGAADALVADGYAEFEASASGRVLAGEISPNAARALAGQEPIVGLDDGVVAEDGAGASVADPAAPTRGRKLRGGKG